jgi:uncharacterized protein YdhG (YjbR/CyaY superfamily)
MEKGFQFSSFEEYVASQPEEVNKALKEVSEYILEAVPGAIKLINYNIPAFALIDGGKRDHQIMIAGYKKHIGFYPHPTTMEHFWEQLGDYKKAKGSVQFPLSKPLPKELIIEMVRFRKGLLDEELNKK